MSTTDEQLDLVREEVVQVFDAEHLAQALNEGLDLLLRPRVQHIVAVLHDVNQSVLIRHCNLVAVGHQGDLSRFPEMILRDGHREAKVFHGFALVVFNLH